MKRLEVTDEQYAFIQHLREEIAADVVGKYGFVREQDAVQFLIDNLEVDVDIGGEFEASAVDDVAESVVAAIEGDPEPHDLQSVSYVESAEPAGAESAGTEPIGDTDEEGEETDSEADQPESDDEDSGEEGESTSDATQKSDEDDDQDGVEEDTDDADVEEDTDDADVEKAADEDAEEDDESAGDADEEETEDGTEDDGADTDAEDEDDDSDGAADDDDMLNEMMSLLDTHDDKWEESSSADFRYTVELPDGSSENVQTKDDVRALLFKNYR